MKQSKADRACTELSNLMGAEPALPALSQPQSVTGDYSNSMSRGFQTFSDRSPNGLHISKCLVIRASGEVVLCVLCSASPSAGVFRFG